MKKIGRLYLIIGSILGILTLLILGFSLGLISPVYNPFDSLLSGGRPLRTVTILGADNQVLKVLSTREDLPKNIFEQAGLHYLPGDVLTNNGQVIEFGQPVPATVDVILKYQPRFPITLIKNGVSQLIYSAAPTLGRALWDNGIILSSKDSLSILPETPLTQPLTVTLRRAAPLTIQVGSQTYQTSTAAETVGQALLDAGLSLQNDDYSQPAEDQPLPENRSLQLIRVSEQIVLEQKVIPFESETVTSDSVPLGQTQVIQPGQTGLQVSRVRVRTENGLETSRSIESDWTVSQPVKQKVGVGTQASILTLDTPSGTIEYYRSMTVYATSYSPCNSDADRCYPSTANGMKVQRGVIGVTKAWYKLLAGQRVYIPGYGIAVIADIGAGIPGKQWIDLGFSDSDYVPWSQNVTIYFLTPVPSNVTWNLP